MSTLLQSVLFEGAGLGGYAWLLPFLFFAVLGGGLYAYFSKQKSGILGKLGDAVASLTENPYKLLAYTAGIAVLVYIMSQLPAIAYVNMIAGIALYTILALDLAGWIASAFKQ